MDDVICSYRPVGSSESTASKHRNQFRLGGPDWFSNDCRGPVPRFRIEIWCWKSLFCSQLLRTALANYRNLSKITGAPQNMYAVQYLFCCDMISCILGKVDATPNRKWPVDRILYRHLYTHMSIRAGTIVTTQPQYLKKRKASNLSQVP